MEWGDGDNLKNHSRLGGRHGNRSAVENHDSLLSSTCKVDLEEEDVGAHESGEDGTDVWAEDGLGFYTISGCSKGSRP